MHYDMIEKAMERKSLFFAIHLRGDEDIQKVMGEERGRAHCRHGPRGKVCMATVECAPDQYCSGA